MYDDAIELVKSGCVGVLPTDTLYGIVGSALVPEAVDRIYALKQRDTRKPLIVLIPDVHSLEQFGVVLSEELIEKLGQYWPGPYSIILPTIDDQFEYLSRGTDTIAFRLPDEEELLRFLSETGPIVAPSANTEGDRPAVNINAARAYFGTDVEFYIDKGELDNHPSTILRYEDGEFAIVRE